MEERFRERLASYQLFPGAEMKERIELSSVQIRKKKRYEQAAKRRALASGYIGILAQKTIALSELPEAVVSLEPSLGRGELGNLEKLKILRDMLDWSSEPDIKRLILEIIFKISACEEELSIETLLCLGFGPIVLSFLDNKFPEEIRYLACLCIANLACGDANCQKSLFKSDVLNSMRQTINFYDLNFSALAIKVFANIGNECTDIKIHVAQSDVLESIDYLVSNFHDLDLLRAAGHFLYVYNKDLHRKIRVVANILKALLRNSDTEILEDVFSVLSTLALSDQREVAMLLVTGKFYENVIECLQSRYSASIIHKCLNIVGNLIAHDGEEFENIVNKRLVQSLASLTGHCSIVVQKKTFWVFGNIAGCKTPQVVELLGTDIIKMSIDKIRSAPLSVATSAAKFLSVFMLGSKNHHKLRLLEFGLLDAVAEGINRGKIDYRFLVKLLDIALHILAAGVNDSSDADNQFSVFHAMETSNCKDAIEGLVLSSIPKVSKLADEIIGTFYISTTANC